MTLRHMRIFAEVYRTRNVTHAAQDLHMTQPAVTRAIQELEQHYGVRLFERLYRHLSPTEAAQRLYAQAVYLLDTFDHMEAAMRDWDSLGVVRVGATVTLGSTILPVLARRFAALYPGIELQAKVANGSVLADALCENQLDLALLENSVSVPDLHTEPIGTDCLCAVLAPAHPLAQQAALTLQQLVGGRCCAGTRQHRAGSAGTRLRGTGPCPAPRMGKREHCSIGAGRRPATGRGDFAGAAGRGGCPHRPCVYPPHPGRRHDPPPCGGLA